MSLGWRLLGVAAAGLVLNGCGGDGDEIAAPSEVVPSTPTTLVIGDGSDGDPAVWLLTDQMAAIGYGPAEAAERVSAESSSFTAHVMRVGCSGGQTGTVLPPAVIWSDTQITVTFLVDALPPDQAYPCPSNDLVAYEVELGDQIGQRRLVDGTCASGPAVGTLFCGDEGVRWSPGDSAPHGSVGATITGPTIPTSVATSFDAAPPTLDLSQVPPASVAMAISEFLSNVQLAVRAEVGDDVFAGSAFTNDTNDSMTIYGTDAAAIAAALDHINPPLRDQISVVETQYSLNEIETWAEQAQAGLEAAGIAGTAGVIYGVDAVVVQLETPDGEPDASIQNAAADVLGDIPVTITFSAPSVDL